MTDAPKNPKEMAILGRWTQNYATEKGYMKTLSKSVGQGFDDIKGITTSGSRGIAFGRIAGVTAGAAIAGDALFRGKDSDGNDRGLLARLGEFVLGTGVAVGSLVVGKGR
jgi:hypothetical protein